MLDLGSLDVHMEKRDGWFIWCLSFAGPVEEKDKKTKKKEVHNISRSLIFKKESKLGRMWLTDIGRNWRSTDSGSIGLQNRCSDSS